MEFTETEMRGDAVAPLITCVSIHPVNRLDRLATPPSSLAHASGYFSSELLVHIRIACGCRSTTSPGRR